MAVMLVFMVFMICLLVFTVAEVFLVIRWFIDKRKNRADQKRLAGLKRNTVLLAVNLILTGGIMIFSQLTAKTPSILDDQGKPLAGSIAELQKVNLNGRQEWISVRGNHAENPVLLFLAGGPGGTQMAAVRHDLSRLEEHFVVVVWDQPGSGKSYRAGGAGLTVNTYIEDGLALTKYLQEQFKQDKIYLVGESWGSALGIFLSEQSPDSYHAVIGTGQMIDFLETERMDYEKAMQIAESTGDQSKIDKLKENGRPPYYGSDVTWKSAEYLNYLSAYMSSNPEIQNGGYNTFRDLFSPEYGILDKINFLRGIVNTFNHVYPQLYGINLRTDYPRLEVPVYFFLGRHDINAPSVLVEEYFSILEAPSKEIIWFEHSGHSPWINESDKFVDELIAVREKQ